MQGLRKPGGKNPKGSSQWQAPLEWTLGPTSVRREQHLEEDLGALAWGADSYDGVMARLRSL